MAFSKNKISGCLLLLIILTAGLSLECKKRIFDYRNKYVGDWKFSYTVINCPTKCDTTSGEYDGKIFYERTFNKDQVYIEFTTNLHDYFSIDKKGNFLGCAFTGKFTNSTHVFFTETISQACGGGHSRGSYTVTGIKK